MSERLCIDPKIVAKSNNRATCSKRYDKYLVEECVGCPKRTNNGFPLVENLKSESERFEAEVHAERKEHLTRRTASKTGFYLPQ